MSDVKRWTISLPNPDGYAISPWKPGLFHSPTDVMLASDYDALRARLAEELAEQDRVHNRKLNDMSQRHADQIDALKARLAEAEKLLRAVKPYSTVKTGIRYTDDWWAQRDSFLGAADSADEVTP